MSNQNNFIKQAQLKMKHTKHGLINHLFNSHYNMSHQFKTPTKTLYFHMFGTKAMIHSMEGMLLPAFEENELGMTLISSIPSSKSQCYCKGHESMSTQLGTTMLL